MALDLDLPEFALRHAMKLGAGYAEVRSESLSGSGFLVKNGMPEISGFEKETGIGIRLIVDKTLGFSSTNKMDKKSIIACVERAVKMTRNASKISEHTSLSEDKVNVSKYEVRQKIKLEDIPAEKKLQILLDAEKCIKETRIEVPGSYLSLSDSITEKYFVNSEGSKIFSRIPRANFYYYITVSDKGKTNQRYWQYGAAGGFENFEKWKIPELLKSEVKALQLNLRKGAKPPKGEIDIVAAPQVVGIMVHESCGHPCEADRILGREAAQAGESFITPGMIGERVGSDAVNIADDPTIDGSFGYFMYDDEGVKARRKLLYKEGIINELLHNRETSAALGLKSNGSARAKEYNREAIVRMSNTVFVPGDYSEEELIEGVKLGIYMKNFTEWNIDDKRYNQKYIGAESYLIKNGKIAGPVQRPTIEISTPALYKSVDAAANNVEYHAGSCGKAEPMQAIPVWFGGPSIRLRKIRLSN